MSILDGSCVELTEVNAKAQTTILFPHHHHWRGPWAVRGADDVTGQHLLHLCHLLPTNCRFCRRYGWRSGGPWVSIAFSSSGVFLRLSSPRLKTSLNSLNNLFSCCCWSGERRSGSGGWHGFEGCEEEVEAEAGASARVTTSRTPMLCPE